MDNWKLKKLNEFIIFNPKESIKRGTLAKQILMENLEPYNKYLRGFKYTEFKGGSRFKNGDTLLVRLALCLDNGKTAKVTILDDDETAFGSTEFIVLRKIEEVSDEDFIYYLSISPRLREIAIKSSIGATRERVNQNALENFEINLPPLEEQKAIANTLSCLDEKIELNNKINKNLEEILQTIFKRWYIDFEYPLTKEEITNGGREFVNSELGKIPKGWSVVELGNICNNIICGKTPPTKDKSNFGNKIPFITIPDMHNNTYIIKTERYLSDKGAKSQSNKFIPKNSICISCIATIGLVSITTENSQTNQQINSIICEENLLYYLYYFISNSKEKLKDIGSSGSTTYNINKEQFSKIKLILPTIKLLEEYKDIAYYNFNKILTNQQENEKLKQIRDILLPKLINGDIRVPY